MTSQLDYLTARARQAELVRQAKEAEAPEPARRAPRFVGRLFVVLRLRRPAPASVPCR